MNNCQSISNSSIVFNEQSLAALLLIKKLENYYNEKYGLDILKSGKSELIINCYIAGGSAVNFYTGNRGTGDLDFELDKRIELPKLELDFQKDNVTLLQKLFIDAIYLDVFNENYQDGHVVTIKPFVFSPEDLVISKLSRWAKNDRNDARELVRLGLVNQDVLEEKIEDALIDYIGLNTFLRYNIKELYDYFNLPKIDFSNDRKELIISQIIYDEIELRNIFKQDFLNKLHLENHNFNFSYQNIKPDFKI